MKIIIISDTHERHTQVKVPDGDLLIHCGDWTNQGSPGAIENFLKWFSAQPHTHKVCIPGNHEISLEGAQQASILELINRYCVGDTHFLLNSSINIAGYKLYGSPVTPRFYNWAFNRNRGKDIAIEWAKIPDDTNILITHGPPYGVLDLTEEDYTGRDLHQGCEELAKRVKELKQLALHCYGHLHLQGSNLIKINNTIFANCAICTERYQPTNPPLEIDL